MQKKFYKGKTDAMFKAIFCDSKNKDLLERLLSEATGKKLEVISIKSPELIKANIYVKGKTMDVLVKTDDGLCNIEVNSYSDIYLHRRNMAYIANRYGNGLESGKSYDEMKNFIQINLTSEGDYDIPPYEKYLVKGELTNREYVDNFIIYEFNLPKLKKACYNDYKFIALLDCEEDELKTLCEGDKEMEKFEKEVYRLNDDEEFFRLMTDEEENESLKNTYIGRGFKQGVEQGEKSGKQKRNIEIAKEMVNNNIAIDLIIKCTGLTEEEINNL